MQNRALILTTSPSSAIEVGRLFVEADCFQKVSLMTSAVRDIRLNTRLQELVEGGLEVLQGEPTNIDFGLSGAEFLRLRQQVSHLVVCGSPGLKLENLFIGSGVTSDLERARPIRLAAEAKEFMALPGEPMTVVLESSFMVFGSSALEVSESDLDVGQEFPTALHQSLAIAEKLLTEGKAEHRLSILRAAPALGRLDDGELFDGTGFAELARRISIDRGSFKVAAQGNPVQMESLERIAWALTQLSRLSQEGTFHLLDEDKFTDLELLTWFARRFKVQSPLAPREKRVKSAAQWAGQPGAELTFGNSRQHLSLAGAKIFEEKLGVRTLDYLSNWFPEEEN